MNKSAVFHLPAEWYPQDAVLLAWPHKNTDWAYMLAEVQEVYRALIHEIAYFEHVVLLCPNKTELPDDIRSLEGDRLTLTELPYNDTWVRDFGPLCVIDGLGGKRVIDYCFDGWGGKFEAQWDNAVTETLFRGGIFAVDVDYRRAQDFIFEGGSIDSDGQGCLLSTTRCIYNPNRNRVRLTECEIDRRILCDLGAYRLHVLHHGYLSGDDTDAHIDTLARFSSPSDIVYVAAPPDPCDEHRSSLDNMAAELATLRKADGMPYRLIKLPMVPPCYDSEGRRLPATYANFLLVNGAVLFPTYGFTMQDKAAEEALQSAFPGRAIIGVNCRPLVEQHGSLHCITMQIPAGFLKRGMNLSKAII